MTQLESMFKYRIKSPYEHKTENLSKFPKLTIEITNPDFVMYIITKYDELMRDNLYQGFIPQAESLLQDITKFVDLLSKMDRYEKELANGERTEND